MGKSLNYAIFYMVQQSLYGYDKQHEGKNRNKFNETSTVMRRTEKTDACLQLVGLKVSL